MQKLSKTFIVITIIFVIQTYGQQENFIPIKGTDNLVDTEVSSRRFVFGTNWRGPAGSTIMMEFAYDREAVREFGEPTVEFQFIPPGSTEPIDIQFNDFPENFQPPFRFLLAPGNSPLICSQVEKTQREDRIVITSGSPSCSGEYRYRVDVGSRFDTVTSNLQFLGGAPPNFAEQNLVTSPSANTLYGLLGTRFQVTVDGTRTVIINATDIAGDPRGNIQWFFTAEGGSTIISLPSSLAGVTIDNSVTGTSILRISGITGVHPGEYRAEATNAHGTDNASAFISQGVAPFILQGSGQSNTASFRVGARRGVVLGETVTIRAEDQQSNPSSVITWSYSRSPLGPFTAISQGGAYSISSQSGGNSVGTDSTLTVSNVQDAQFGYYRAEAVNVHGRYNSASSVIGKAPVLIRGTHIIAAGCKGNIGSTINGARGSTLAIRAFDRVGFPSSTYIWQRIDISGASVDIASGGRYRISDSLTGTRPESTLIINGVTDHDIGVFRVTASNDFGTDFGESLVGRPTYICKVVSSN